MKRAGSSWRIRAGLLLAVASTWPACGGRVADGPLSVLLVTLDTTRADALGCYDGKSAATPALDAIAEESLLFERAYTVAPLTLPAHTSMLTGLYPLRHGLRDNGVWALPNTARTLAETAREGGFQTAAFLEAVVLDRNFGLDQGFDVYDVPAMPPGQRSSHIPSRSAAAVVDAAIGWLRRRARPHRFFLWVHLFDPHAPYEPPAAFAARFPSEPYLGEVAAMDGQIGRLLEALDDSGDLDETLVMLVADHGESLGEHREETHGPFCYDTTLHVPMIVRYPDGYRGGERENGIVSVVDVYPTLAAALELPVGDVPGGIDGVSLFRRSPPPGRSVYFESYYGYFAYGWSPLAGLVDGRYKYVHSSEPKLFDLQQDPGETTNAIGSEAERAAAFLRTIEEIASRPALERDAGAGVDAAKLAQIRNLGYAAAADAEDEVPHPLAASDRPAPARMADEIARTDDAQQAMNARDYPRAETLLRALLQRNLRNLKSANLLGLCLAYQGRCTEAIPLFRRVVAEGPPRADARVSLGLCLRNTGAVDEARRMYLSALGIDPDHLLALRNLVILLESTGRNAEAIPYIERLETLAGR